MEGGCLVVFLLRGVLKVAAPPPPIECTVTVFARLPPPPPPLLLQLVLQEWCQMGEVGLAVAPPHPLASGIAEME
ncbi:hypothetical protein SK128_018922 [Halocaridina rubra]|uniref:Secreted protein n=1 Tax=Halocaridina rubra TaxID=373956 RepID=A0AAN9ACR3_HALRR